MTILLYFSWTHQKTKKCKSPLHFLQFLLLFFFLFKIILKSHLVGCLMLMQMFKENPKQMGKESCWGKKINLE